MNLQAQRQTFRQYTDRGEEKRIESQAGNLQNMGPKLNRKQDIGLQGGLNDKEVESLLMRSQHENLPGLEKNRKDQKFLVIFKPTLNTLQSISQT